MISDKKAQELIKVIKEADVTIVKAARKQDNPKLEVRERKTSEKLKRRLK